MKIFELIKKLFMHDKKKIFYLGSTDMLPPPLKKEEEEAEQKPALGRLGTYIFWPLAGRIAIHSALVIPHFLVGPRSYPGLKQTK